MLESNLNMNLNFPQSPSCFRQTCLPVGLRVSTGGTEHHDQKELGEKRLYVTLYHMTVQHSEKSRWDLKQGRDPGAGADAEAMEEYSLQALLLMVCSACLLTAPRITSPGMATPTVSWALPHQSPIKTMPYRHAYMPILLRYFVQ